MKITYYGHSALGIKINSTNIIVDPFISGNELAKDINIDTLKADYILLTHAHEDHTLDVNAIAKRTGATIVSNYEIATHYQKEGFKAHTMNHGGQWRFDFGVVRYTNAIHTSSFPDGSYGGQPGGFVIEANNKSIYIAGDTAVTMDMKLISMQTKLNLAVLPIGGNFTMGVEDAVIASNLLECDKIMGCHYDSFEPIIIDKDKAKSIFKNAKKELILLDINKSLEV